MNTRLKDGGVYIDWTGLTDIKVWLWSESQKAIAGRCDFEIDEADGTKLLCRYSASKPQYPGLNKIIVQATYMGGTKTFDKTVFNFVRWTADQAGEQITIDDPEVDVEIVAEDISSSVINEAVRAALDAADEALAAKAAVEATEAAVEGAEAARVAAESARETAEAGRVDQASADHNQAAADHTQAGQDHARAETDHGVATTDHEAAAGDHTQAAADHTTAAGDHTQAAADHAAAAADHTQAATDHSTATADHAQASNDHSTAAEDHTAAASDHTQAGADHTQAAADHTTAAADHSQAQADHAVMAGYDTRLVAVEGEVTQLEAKVDELEDGYIVPSYTLINGGINNNGTVGSGTTYKHTTAIPVKKGQKVKVSTAGYNFALISKDENGTYTPQMTVSSGDANVPATYIWTAPNDMSISVTVKSTIAFSIGIGIETDYLQRIEAQLDKKIDGFTLQRGYLDETTSGLIWKDIGTGSRYYYVIPCTAKEKVVVTPGTGNGFIVALSAYEPVSNTPASYTYKKALSAGGSATTFVTPENTTYIYIFASSFGSNRLPSKLSIGGIEYFADLVERVDILSENVDSLMGEEYPYNYNGNKISFGNKFNRRTMFSLSDSYPKAQGAACYGDILFVFHDQNATVQVYNMATLTFVQSIAMSSSEQGTDVHCNSVNFGTEFYDPSDPFPLLYCSTEAQKTIFVYRVILSEGVYSLVRVQTITFANFPTGQNGFNYPNGIPDNWNERLYVMGLKTYPWSSYADNTIILGFYPMPKLSDGDVTLDYSNLQDVFTIPNSPTAQGATFVDGKLYAALGTDQSCMLYVINPSSHIVETKVDLKASGMNDAPENVFYYAGDLYTNWYTKRVIKLIF